ncbi:MAG: HEAT repeat domain-containing protein, partial [Planctomycetota bacterium]
APRVVSREPHCPPALDTLVAHLLEKRIEDRPASAAEVGKRLGGAGEEAQISLRPPLEQNPIAPTRVAAVADEDDDLLSAPAPRSAAASPEPWVKWTAVGALAACGLLLPWFASALSASRSLEDAEARWIATLERGSGEDRIAAARSVGELAEDGDANYAALLEALEADDEAVRTAAAKALATFPSQAGELQSVFTKVERNDTSEKVRAAARATSRALDRPAENPGGRGFALWGWLLGGLTLIGAGVVGWKA